METEIIAKTQSGQEIICAIDIDEKGEIKTQYPVKYTQNSQMGIEGYSIELTKKQAETLLNRKCPVQTVNVMLKNDQDWSDIKEKSEKIWKQYEIRNNKELWEGFLKNNVTLTLTHRAGQNEIFGLPGALQEKKSLLLPYILCKTKELTAKDLAAWIKTLEQQRDNRKNAHKRQLMQKAKETGRPQVLESVSVEYNSHREHWSEDRYVTYINEDGTEFTEEVKAEPDHY